MRRLLWTVLFFCLYVWVMTSGHDKMLLEKGKALYEELIAWFDDAEVDFQIKQDHSKSKKKQRRWD